MTSTKLNADYLRVPHYVFDLLVDGVPAYVFVVAVYLIRRTFGWNKSAEDLSYADIANDTGLGKSTVIRACEAVVALRLFKSKKESGNKTKYVFTNPSSDKWDKLLVADEWNRYRDREFEKGKRKR